MKSEFEIYWAGIVKENPHVDEFASAGTGAAKTLNPRNPFKSKPA
jgi:hypothetical protein